MKIYPILFLVCGALGACSVTTPDDDGGAPVPTRDLGDVVPRELHQRPTPAVARGLAQASIPVSPRDPVLAPEHGGESMTFRGGLKRVEPMTDVVEIPVDTVGAETWLYIQPGTRGEALKAALADIQVLSPTGEQIHTGDGAMNLTTTTGVFQIVAGGSAKQYGMTVELAQPDSPIELALQTSQVVHFPGDATRVDIALLEDISPISNVRVTADLLAPDGSITASLPVRTGVSGRYQVPIAQALQLDAPTGMYGVRVTAEGTTASGVRFFKSGTTAVKYGVATARILEVLPLRLVKSGTLIEAFEVDVRVEVASTDRYEVTGLLAASYKGTLRKITIAQTAEVLEPGEQTLTLRFDAGLVKLTGLEGTFQLEQLQLFSQGRGELLHRIPKGLSTIRAVDTKRANLVEVHVRTPAIDEMITQGLFTP